MPDERPNLRAPIRRRDRNLARRLVEERIAWAKQLLCRRPLSIDDVAEAVGFGSAYTLRHHFRRHVGISPTEYRARFMAELT